MTTMQQPALFPPDKPRCECDANDPADCEYEWNRREGYWHGKRPRNCLCAVDPKTSEWPPGF